MNTMRKTYVKPLIEVMDMGPEAVMADFQSGYNVDGEHQGEVNPSGKPGLSEDDGDWGLNN